ncbi:MAG: hypothetical protein J6P44_00585 [Bacteroidales bacterium]|nr:hypothetical protein [Bacteroidales bacterium]
MKKICLLVCVVILLCACSKNSSDTDTTIAESSVTTNTEMLDTEEDKQEDEKQEDENLFYDSVKFKSFAGRFLSADKYDTLSVEVFIAETGKRVDSVHIDDDNFPDPQIESRIYFKDFPALKAKQCLGLQDIIRLDNLLPDGRDALAIVWNFKGQTSFRTCYIYKAEKNKWKLLGMFTFHLWLSNEDSLEFRTDCIPKFLEKHNGEWMYRDYDEYLEAGNDDINDFPMKKLSSLIKKRK